MHIRKLILSMEIAVWPSGPANLAYAPCSKVLITRWRSRTALRKLASLCDLGPDEVGGKISRREMVVRVGGLIAEQTAAATLR